VKTRILALTTIATLIAATSFAQVIVQTPNAGATPALIPGIPIGAAVPQVVATIPRNGDLEVNPTIRAVRFTFSEPMDVATFYWPLPVGQTDFPRLTGDPYWENNNQTVVLPVSLNINSTYRIPLNQGNQIIFRSAKGVPAYPGVLSFRTAEGVTGAAPSSVAPNRTPTVRVAGHTPRAGDDPGSLGPAGSGGARPPVATPFATVPPTMHKPQIGTNSAAASGGSSIPNAGGNRTRLKTPKPTATTR
jgi:hypothetical protein